MFSICQVLPYIYWDLLEPPYLGVLLGLFRLCGVHASGYLVYLGHVKGQFRLIGALSRVHRFRDPHDSNDPVFIDPLKVSQLVYIGCFWVPS